MRAPGRRMRRAGAAALGLVALTAIATGCAGPAATPAGSSTSDGEEALTGTLTVYAAASLAEIFDELLARFRADHPGVEVAPLVTDGSAALATQIIEGAPADVFASADERTMQLVVDAGAAVDPVLFAGNTLVLVVPAGNPADIRTLDDLPGATVVLCETQVPCGRASRALLDRAGVPVDAASVEQNVTAVLTKVAAGEADAGLVYATDVHSRRDVEVIVPEGADDIVNRYPITVLRDAESPTVAAAFVALVTGPEGQAVLADAGFRAER